LMHDTSSPDHNVILMTIDTESCILFSSEYPYSFGVAVLRDV